MDHSPPPVLASLADEGARIFRLDLVIVRAVIEVESNWNPLAYRYEPLFYKRYVEPIPADTLERFGPSISTMSEKMGRSSSWGLMQVMGQKARELGFKGEYLSALTDPMLGIIYGCRVLNKLQLRYKRLDHTISAYNAGEPTPRNAAYVAKVLAAADRIRKELPGAP